MNHYSKFLLLPFVAMASIQAKAFQLKTAFLSPSKMSDAWIGKKPIDFDDKSMKAGLLPMPPEVQKNFDFELAARWDAMQADPYILAHRYLLQNGFNENPGFLDGFLGNLGVIFGYDYGVAPSFRKGLYTRTDSYTTYPAVESETQILKSSEFLAKTKNMLNFDASYAVEFNFRRQFKDPKEAILSRPYFVQNLPLTAENAIRNLQPGDLFTFNTHMDLVLGGDVIRSLNLLKPGASIGAFGVLSGGFQIHVLRLPNNKIHYKIFSFRKKADGVSADVGLFALDHIPVVHSVEEKIANILVGATNILDVNIQQHWNNSLLLDYVLDLDQPEIAAAFNESMAQAREFSYMQAGNPFKKDSKYINGVMTIVTTLEDLAHKSKISSNYKTHNNATGKTLKLALGNKLLGVSLDVSKFKNEMTIVDDSGVAKKYNVDSKKNTSEFSFLYSLLDTSTEKMNATISEEDRVQASIYLNQKTTRVPSISDIKAMQNQLALSLPKYANQIDSAVWQKIAKEKMHNLSSRTQIVIPIESLQSIPAMNREEIARNYMDYLAGKPIEEYTAHAARLRPNDTVETDEELMAREVGRISQSMEKLFATKTSNGKKVKILKSLFDDSLFQATGWGFLMKLMPSEEYRSAMYIGYHLSTTDGIDIPFVQIPNGPLVKDPKATMELYSHILSSDNLTNDEEIDLILESEGLY